MASSPSLNGYSGRGPGGRFALGNRGGPGNPLGAASQRFRARLFASVTEEDFEEVTKQLILRARAGEEWAVKEFYDRLLGKASQPIEGEGTQRIDMQAIWQGSVDDLIDLARTAGKVDELPPRLRPAGEHAHRVCDRRASRDGWGRGVEVDGGERND